MSADHPSEPDQYATVKVSRKLIEKFKFASEERIRLDHDDALPSTVYEDIEHASEAEDALAYDIAMEVIRQV